METVTTFGEYGQRQTGAASTQIVVALGGAYLVTYTFERWSDLLGTLEVLDIEQLTDEFGMGTIGKAAITDGWTYGEVERQFKEAMHEAVKKAMGVWR